MNTVQVQITDVAPLLVRISELLSELESARESYQILQEEVEKSKLAEQSLQEELERVKRRLQESEASYDWLKRQVFGKTSEKIHHGDSLTLPMFPELEGNRSESSGSSTEAAEEKPRKRRGKRKKLGMNTDSGLRFDDNIEIVTQEILPEEAKGLSQDEYEIVGREISDRLGSRKSKRFINRRVFLKVKIKQPALEDLGQEIATSSEIKSQIIKAPVPEQVLRRSYMSVSFLVDMILDKSLYSLPIYRQHQSLTREGIHVSRSSMIQNFNKGCHLLSGIVEAQKLSIIAGSNVAIDETPMLVGLNEAEHKMQKGFVWPCYGELNEIIFHYSGSRSATVIKDILGEHFRGSILSDGYSAYTSYVSGVNEVNLGQEVVHATCWVHARRAFVKIEMSHPEVYKTAINYIARLYDIERTLVDKTTAEIGLVRATKSSLIVDEYFNWLQTLSGNSEIATSSALRKAVTYSTEREQSMRVFLTNPGVAIDTNHVEREIRPITIGRKNFVFCWTEVGAKALCHAQSLIRTCLLHNINPRTYLIDVLQRVTLHHADEAQQADLIPRLWKDTYAHSPIPCPSEESANLALDKQSAIIRTRLK